MPLSQEDHTDRVLRAALKGRRFSARAVDAVRKATSLLSLAVARQITEARNSEDPLRHRQAEPDTLRVVNGVQEQTIEILGARFDKIPERQRPHYTPAQRFSILKIRAASGLTIADTARLFRLSASTVLRWEAETCHHPEKETIGSLLKPVPPVRRYADAVHHLIQSMILMGFGGSELVAHTLTRAGWRISRETVRRYRKRPLGAPLPEIPAQTSRGADRLAVRAKEPNHVWMMDIAEVKGFLGLSRFSIISVFDVFSRRPLLTRAFDAPPTAADTALMLREAARAFSAPRHLVTDQGVHFKAEAFTAATKALGVRQRFGRIGHSGSIALIERWWRTLKGSLWRGFLRPTVREDVTRAVELAIDHYTNHRPHRGLGGATPAEVFAGLRPAHLDAIPPPRGRPGENIGTLPVRIDFLDREELRFPILVKIAA